MLETCGSCGTRFAVGLLACPHCQVPLEPAADDGQGDGDKGDGDEEADVAKITKRGVTFDAEHDPDLDGFAPVSPVLTEPEPDVEDVPEPVVTPEPGPAAETPSAPPAPRTPPRAPKAGA